GDASQVRVRVQRHHDHGAAVAADEPVGDRSAAQHPHQHGAGALAVGADDDEQRIVLLGERGEQPGRDAARGVVGPGLDTPGPCDART
ncbi:MAG: hypothetical protein QOD82_4177, partial [Pseudonocardiales bacterium]|nr:hypothetical protein [Pseudonocardiales bacterium]